MIYCFLLFIFILYLYTFGISTYKRLIDKEVLRYRTVDKPIIALTFDDGPNALYTPQVLDILKKYSIPGNFFLIVRNAAQHPEIVARMKNEGHLIGIHTYSHKHAWLMTPWSTYYDFKKSIKIYTSLVGCKPRWFRPPWGTFNLFTHFFAKYFSLRTAYWSIEAYDWKSSTTSAFIKHHVIAKAKPGSIIVLHDNNGAPGAPARTIEALPGIIETLLSKGYRFITLDEMEEEASEKISCMDSAHIHENR